MNIDRALNTIMQFYSWISIQTGLKNWQLLTIALVVLCGLVLFLNYLRKARIQKIHLIQSSGRSEIIGIKLSGDENRYHEHYRKKQTFALPEEEEKQHSWGQTTKDWRKLRENIRHLQHDISKYERTEKLLKEQISELKIANEKLQAEINTKSQTEDALQQQIKELTPALSYNYAEQTRVKNEYQEEPLDLQQITHQTEHTSEEKSNETNFLQSKSSEKQDKIAKEISKEDFDPSETIEKENNVPLDIKELKAIADLVKRLQARSQQRQSE